jgi:hypothetical protein
MSGPVRRMSEGAFWDAAAVSALRGLMTNAGDVLVSLAVSEIPKNCAAIADGLAAERRKRIEAKSGVPDELEGVVRVKALVALTAAVHKAHDAHDASAFDELQAEAARIGMASPDVLRRLADLAKWKREAGR